MSYCHYSCCCYLRKITQDFCSVWAAGWTDAAKSPAAWLESSGVLPCASLCQVKFSHPGIWRAGVRGFFGTRISCLLSWNTVSPCAIRIFFFSKIDGRRLICRTLWHGMLKKQILMEMLHWYILKKKESNKIERSNVSVCNSPLVDWNTPEGGIWVGCCSTDYLNRMVRWAVKCWGRLNVRK